MSKTILVVDDEPLIAMTTVDMLEDLGHTAIEAHSGIQAMEIVSSGARIDLLMTDHSMPGMHGSELAVAAREVISDLPVIFVTGHSELPAGLSGTSGHVSLLTKPFFQDDLRAALEEVFGHD